MTWTAEDIPDMSGKVVVVTGANTGLGLVDAKRLAQHGATVVMACRSVDKAAKAAEELRQELGPDAGELIVMELDLSSSVSIKSFVQKFRDRKLPLHVLINNAGVANIPFGKTADGYEITLGTNHIGTYLLTVLLMDILKASAPARVVTVSSMAADMATIPWDDIAGKDLTRTGFDVYGTSKLYNSMFAMELERRLEGSNVHSYSVHPGAATSDMTNKMESNFTAYMLTFLSHIFCQSTEKGALSTLYCATAEEVKDKGGIFVCPNYLNMGNTSIRRPMNAAVRDPDALRRLWEETATIVGVDL